MLDQAARLLCDTLELGARACAGGLRSQALLPALTHLTEQRAAAFEQLAELDLILGRHEHCVGPSAEFAAEHPLREQVVRNLMLALYRSGRRSDALAAYRHLSARLGAELGTEPSEQLSELHIRMLRGDPGAGLGRRPASNLNRPSGHYSSPARRCIG